MSTAESMGLKILNYTLIEMDGAPLKKPWSMRASVMI